MKKNGVRINDVILIGMVGMGMTLAVNRFDLDDAVRAWYTDVNKRLQVRSADAPAIYERKYFSAFRNTPTVPQDRTSPQQYLQTPRKEY